MLAQLTSSSQRLEVRVGRVLVAGTVAFCTQLWRRSSLGAAPSAFEHSSTARLVLIRDGARGQIAIASRWE